MADVRGTVARDAVPARSGKALLTSAGATAAALVGHLAAGGHAPAPAAVAVVVLLLAGLVRISPPWLRSSRGQRTAVVALQPLLHLLFCRLAESPMRGPGSVAAADPASGGMASGGMASGGMASGWMLVGHMAAAGIALWWLRRGVDRALDLPQQACLLLHRIAGAWTAVVVVRPRRIVVVAPRAERRLRRGRFLAVARRGPPRVRFA